MSTTLGKNIKDLRTSLNMTLADVAEKTGVSRQTIQRYESGVISNIPAQRLQALASALGTTPDYLMGLSQFKTKEEMTKYFDDKFLTPELVEEANRPDGQVVGYVPGLSDKEEKDIQKKLDNILNQLDNETGLMFDGEVVDDETKEKLRISLEMVMRGAKKEAKEKFTPKKYKK
ncbi:MAG: helix-turn-helix domain-containing protein [Clostridiales Family XIII bacterium]|uniref:Helix-turn-helix domain-containing protein n=1 Tax=Hominibacterium faecale TaxID=2839743 RepID=A0A9J6QW04_9FIRM|nr:helix-turn-helix domain-containing protein [Hominibacterium faecale]MCI7304076.1 helix-turn-helix domain-containing protein [Clostridia bacterium]MCU7379751.1 helix-turn-helix domain-containing protein [Hominibacterium faecale]MDY3011726.1 helix-turn-helix domain-containing protein [Clostridiales Family XIII bacterium]